jgi:hypothetical protein
MLRKGLFQNWKKIARTVGGDGVAEVRTVEVVVVATIVVVVEVDIAVAVVDVQVMPVEVVTQGTISAREMTTTTMTNHSSQTSPYQEQRQVSLMLLLPALML